MENLVKGAQWVEEVLVGARVNKIEEDVADAALLLKHELLVVEAAFVRVDDLEDQRQEKADHRAEPFRVTQVQGAFAHVEVSMNITLHSDLVAENLGDFPLGNGAVRFLLNAVLELINAVKHDFEAELFIREERDLLVFERLQKVDQVSDQHGFDHLL